MSQPTGDAIARDATVEDFSVRGTSGPIPRPYGEALLAAARRDPRVVCLCADLPGPTETDIFREALRERYIDAGIAEANMVGMAAGMARSGEIPFVHSFCVFLTRRVYDQIANQIAYPRLPVKLVGFLPGLTTPLGVSHQAIDDIALMRALPNMTIIEPSGPEQAASAVAAAIEIDGPVYLRMKRPDGPHVGRTDMPLPKNSGLILRKGTDGVVFASGLMVAEALTAAHVLAAEGTEISVVNMSTIKPLDHSLILEAARPSRVVVTAENHSIIGGLASAVADVLIDADFPVAMERVGVRDTFAEGGTTRYLLTKYGLTAADIIEAYRRARAKLSEVSTSS